MTSLDGWKATLALGTFALLFAAQPATGLLRAEAEPAPVGGNVVTVVASCNTFTPDVVTIQNGDTLRFLWDDQCGGLAHQVISTGTTLDAQQDLNKPPPGLFQASCFSGSLFGFQREFKLSLTFAGLVVNELGGNNPTPCIGANSLLVGNTGVSGVIPYYCNDHGAEQPAGQGMRGAIIIGF